MGSSSPRRVVWIAGVGARDGLGAVSAHHFARHGFIAVLTGRTATRVAAVADDIHAAGGEAHALPGDVSVEHEVDVLARQVAGLGPLAVAVFNAAGMARAPTLELSGEQFTQAWRDTALSGFLFGAAAIRSMLANGIEADQPNGRGTLLVTGATASLRGRPPFAAFAAAKAALRSLAQTFAREFGPQGIHIAHIIIDGSIDSVRVRETFPERAASAGIDGLLDAQAIAETYWQLHMQHRSAWTHELDLRPYKENF